MIDRIIGSFESKVSFGTIHSFEVHLKKLKVKVFTNKTDLKHYKNRFEYAFSRLNSNLELPDFTLRLYQLDSPNIHDFLRLPSSKHIPPEFISFCKAGLLERYRKIYFDPKTQDRCIQIRPGEYFLYSPKGDVLYLGHKTHPKMILTIVREMLIHRNHGLQFVHGAAVAVGSHGLVMAGPEGSGKTTLMLALLKKGVRFLTNDNVFLLKGRILPFLDAIDTCPDVAEIFPELDAFVPKNQNSMSYKRSIAPESLTDVFRCGISNSAPKLSRIFNLHYSTRFIKPEHTLILDSPLKIPSIATPFSCLTFWTVPLLYPGCDYDLYFHEFYQSFLQFWGPLFRSKTCFNLFHGPNIQLTLKLISQNIGVKL